MLFGGKSYGYGSESDKRTPYFAYRQILNDLFKVLRDEYFLKGSLEKILNDYNSKHPNLFGSKEGLSKSRSNSILHDDCGDRNTSKTSLHQNEKNSKGLYKDMLSLFFKRNHPVILAFDYNFPGFWSPYGTQSAVPQGDQKIIISFLITEILNTCSEAGIRIHITLDDFQVWIFIKYSFILKLLF